MKTTGMGARSGRFGAAALAVVAALAMLAFGSLETASPAAAQGGAILRAQTGAVTGAINRQIQQAMRPRLQIRNGAGAISQMELSADGRSLAIISADGGLRVWDIENGLQVRRLSLASAGGVTALDVGSIPTAVKSRSTGGQRVVVTGGSDGGATLFDAVSGSAIRSFRGHQGAVQAARLSPDGSVLATGGADRTIRLWEVASGRQTGQLTGHSDAVTALVFAPGGRTLVSGSADGSVRLWALPAGTVQNTLSGAGKVTALAVAADGKVAAGSADGTVRLWSASGAPQGSWSAERGPVTGLGLARSGAVVTAGGGGEAHLWRDSGSATGKISDANNRVALATFSPDGSRVITAGSSGLARVWDAASGKFQAQLILTNTGWAVTDASGRFDGSERGLGNVSWAADQGVFDISNFSEPYYEPGLLAKTMRAPGALITASASPVESGVGVPPSVSINAANGTSAAAPGPATITVTATDLGGGIGQVKLFQNDKAVDPSRVSADSGPGRTRTVSYGVELMGGSNNFRAAAFSVERIEGQSGVLTVRVATPERKPTLHLVVVGINQYANPQMTLNYAVADAKGFVQWAKKQVNPDFAKIEVHSLFDGNATRAAILDQFRQLKATQPEDVVVIYLAGHGENASGSWHFLPTEFGNTMSLAGVASEGVSSKMFEDGIMKMGASRVFMLIDACKSGGLNKAFAADADRKDLQLVSRSAGIHVLAATDKDQLAVELSELGHGAFTYTVLQGLDGRASSDSVIRAKSVLNYASENVPVIAFKYTSMEQFPTVFSRGSDFEVGRKSR